MRSGRLYIGLDLGTSGLKGIVVADDGAVVARAQAAYPTRRPVSRAAEQDPADWIGATEGVIGELGRQSGTQHWAGIGLSGMIPTLVTLNATRVPTGPAVIWEDGRAEAHGVRLRDLVGAEDLYRSTGQWLDGRYLLPMYHRLAQEERRHVEKTATICSAKDYLFLHLTGVLATDPSTAAGFGCYGLETGAWLPKVLATANELLPGGLPALPEVLTSLAARPLLPDVASAMGLPDTLPVCLGAADSVLGALGLGVRADGEVAYVAGTSSVILGVSSRLVFDRSHRYLVTPMAEQGAWGLEMDLLATGSSLSWLAGALLGSQSPADVGELARNVSPEDAPVFLPYLGGGEQGALWDPALRAAIIGLDLRHDRNHLARALLNGIVLESRRCLAVLEDAGLPASTVYLTGGSAGVLGFARDLADATRRRVATLPNGDTDSSALGAAALAARAIEGSSFAPAYEAVAHAVQRVVEPDKERRPLWDRLSYRHDRALAAVRRFYDDDLQEEA